MREKVMQFMIGRNGNDDLNRFLLGADMVLILLSIVFSRSVGRVFSALVVVLLGITYYRMFSRDLMRRSDENAKYLRMRERLLSAFRIRKEQWTQRKDFKFFVCPECKATLRVPKGRGKIKIVCRKCGHSFMGKS